MRFILNICVAVLLTACQQNNSPTTAHDALWKDDLFKPVAEPVESPEQIFALPQQVKLEIRSLTRSAHSAREKTDLLLNYLFSKKGTNLLYQNDATLTATETMAARQANCLSLTILSFSLAQEIDLNVEFRDVKIPEYWTQNNGQSLLNGHVNLNVVGGKNINSNGNIDYSIFSYVIDFGMESNRSHFPSATLKQSQVIAMFYNNKAAEAMVYDRDDLAYTYLKAAIKADPQAAENWNNLAVLYRKMQQLELAEKAYLLSIQLDPVQLNSRANLALLYEATGQTEKAEQLKRQVDSKRNQNPYYHIMLGDEAFASGHAQLAIGHYRKSLALDKKSSEALFGLAKAHLLLGMTDKAEQYLRSAQRAAPNSSERERYQGKLDLLTSAVMKH
ncbi:MAG: tetratricopeptide repeat protein [Gammaproteobacteria bacterium]|nr:tetratricopeptide repeat protein [Gammaproteobacteria bacterium]